VAVISVARNSERLARIGLVLTKHGLGELISRLPLGPLRPSPPQDAPPRTLAVRLREALVELGPSFIKLGQVLSTRTDLLPEDLVRELRKLQDSVPPMTPEEVDEAIAANYGESFDKLFASFDKKPLASASIGQVHLAKLRDDGSEVDVVVKLQRPGAGDTVARDLDLMYMFARLVVTHIPESKVYSPIQMVAEFDRAITAELDYRVEADNAARFRRNFANETGLARFPLTYATASGKRALVMERFVGKHLDRFIADHPEAGPRIARNALKVVAKMIFEDGFFHADPHPGNIIMLGEAATAQIGLIDLGMVGRLSEETRDAAVGLLLAAVTADSYGLADALLSIGKPNGRIDMRAYRAEVAALSEKYLGKPLKEIELSGLIRDLVQGAVKYDIDMPAELLMVGKALMTIEIIGRRLDPDIDIWTELRPYFVELVKRRYTPERMGKMLIRASRALTTGAIALPGQIHDILEDARAGRLSIVTTDPGAAAATDRLGKRILSAAIVASCVASATALLVADRHPSFAVLLYAIAFLQVTWRIWADRKRATS